MNNTQLVTGSLIGSITVSYPYCHLAANQYHLMLLRTGTRLSEFHFSQSLINLNFESFGRGEAVVVIVIKLLEDAIRDGDKIYATVLNTAVNSTGTLLKY